MGAPPERIGPYQVVRELGRGGMGVVYEARHPGLPRSVALKQIHAQEASPAALARFTREAEVLGRVRHPSVVVIHAQGATSDGPYLVEELVDGEPLSVKVRGGALDPREAARIVRAIADALVAIHAQGVIHRDLKPANVMLSSDGRPVLLDFGLARDVHAERLTRTGDVFGTVSYMPPEQANGEQVDERADVYSLGAVLYELLLGRPPFRGAIASVLQQILQTQPAWPRAERAAVPSGLDAVVRRAMAKARDDRYPSAAALRDDLDRFLSGRTPQALAAARRRLLLPFAPVLLAATIGAVLLLKRSGESAAATGAAPVATQRERFVPEPDPPPIWGPPGKVTYALELVETGTLQDLRFRATLALDAGARKGPLLVHQGQVKRIVCGMKMAEPYDSDEHKPTMLSMLDAMIGKRFQCSVDQRTGEVEMSGFRRIFADVQATARPEDWNMMGGMMYVLLRDEFIGASMDALVHVVEHPILRWRKVGPEDWRITVGNALSTPALPPMTVQPDPSAVFEFEGESARKDGVLTSARIKQRRVGGEMVETVWSMELLPQ